MKVSLSWLNEYIHVKLDVSKLADSLTMAGLEVDSFHDRYEYLNSVIVGKITEKMPHPNSEMLKICKVDIGHRTLSIVCGAPNADKGLLAPVALPGTELFDGTKIEKNMVRGEISEGMLCSEAELGLGFDQSGIMVLSNSLKPGKPITEALSLTDMVLDIDLAPNRPDCLGVLGIAREVAAICGTKVHYPEIKFSGKNKRDIKSLSSVIIEAPGHCPRYAARIVEGITVCESPHWLKDRLLSVGLRPINNIVDITNFVMMETGQPLHAFDFDLLAENRIVVRTAKEGEIFTTLDGKEQKLSKDMLMICDGRQPVALAGVMGGLNSEISNNTKRVLIESAYFSPVSIRRTSKKLQINTDASHRFERGVDPEGAVNALNRAAILMAEIGKGDLIEGVIDVFPGAKPNKTIELSVKDSNRFLGLNLDKNKVKAILESIEFNVSEVPDEMFMVTPPSFRVDIKRPVDLMEEIARLYGYNNIPVTFPKIAPMRRALSPQLALRKKIKDIMTGLGFTEAINYSFINGNFSDKLNLPLNDRRRNTVKILNPLSEDQTEMRSIIVPCLIGDLKRNLAQQVTDLKLFEIGKTFINKGKNELPEEIEFLSGIWTGARKDPSWHDVQVPCDFYDLKGAVEDLLKELDVENIIFSKLPKDECYFTRHGYSAAIGSEKTKIGVIGELHPEVLYNFDIKQAAYIFEINLDALAPFIPEIKQAKPLPRYPSVLRDLTIIIDADLEAQKILESIKENDDKFVESVHVFDLYDKEPIQRGKRSISFRIVYRSADKTLSDSEVNELHKSIADNIIRQFKAALPA